MISGLVLAVEATDTVLPAENASRLVLDPGAIALGPGQLRRVRKPTPAKMKPRGFVRPTPAGFFAELLVSSMGSLLGVSVFVTLAQQRL